MTTRRVFLKNAALSIGAVAVGPTIGAFAADTRPLITGVADACRRLAPLGWRQMLLDVTGGQLDIAATDLQSDCVAGGIGIDRQHQRIEVVNTDVVDGNDLVASQQVAKGRR